MWYNIFIQIFQKISTYTSYIWLFLVRLQFPHDGFLAIPTTFLNNKSPSVNGLTFTPKSYPCLSFVDNAPTRPWSLPFVHQLNINYFGVIDHFCLDRINLSLASKILSPKGLLPRNHRSWKTEFPQLTN